MRKNAPVIAALLLPGAVIITIFLAMMTSMVRYSLSPGSAGIIESGFTIENYTKFLGSSFYWGYLFDSLRLSLYCTLISAVLGYIIAYAMYRSSSRMRVIMGGVLIVQFFTAYVIRTYAVMLLLGRGGIVNTTLLDLNLIERPIKLLFTEAGVAIGLVMISIPFMVFPILASLQRISSNVEMASTSLGATQFQTFWGVIFPLSMPGLAAGIVIVYLFELTSYIVPALLGGGYSDMIANLIYNKAMRSFEYSFAAAAAVITLVLSAAIVFAMNKLFDFLIRYERA